MDKLLVLLDALNPILNPITILLFLDTHYFLLMPVDDTVDDTRGHPRLSLNTSEYP